MMIFTNELAKTTKVAKSTAEAYAKILSPFAPHLGEELWYALGHRESIAYAPWPKFDPEKAKDDVITMAVQVNGKTRCTLDVPAGISQQDFMSEALKDERVSKQLEGKTIVKEIYVPGKICNIVIK
jgi:leucyl-tRNA synthetase